MNCLKKPCPNPMGSVRNPYGRQRTSPMQTRQIDRIPSIRLDPVPRLARDQRRGYHHAVVPRSGQLTLDAVAARPGLIAKPEHRSVSRELARKPRQSGRRVGNLSMRANLAASARRQSNRYRLFVNIQTDVGDMPTHAPSPMREALRQGIRRAARDAGELSGPTSEEKARSEPLKAVVHSGAIGSSPMGDGSSPMASALERENRELRQANEILKKGEPMERQWSERHWRTHISLRRSSTALSANDRVHRRSP